MVGEPNKWKNLLCVLTWEWQQLVVPQQGSQITLVRGFATPRANDLISPMTMARVTHLTLIFMGGGESNFMIAGANSKNGAASARVVYTLHLMLRALLPRSAGPVLPLG